MSLVLAFALQPAMGFAPHSETADGVGIEPQRVQTRRPNVQARYLRSPVWQTFIAGEGAGWRAIFDEHTGTPRTMWGGRVSIPNGTPAQVDASVRRWLDRHHELLGFASGALALVSANHVPSRDTWYLQYDVLRDDLPVYRGGISARVKGGNLVLLQVATSPRADVDGSYVLSAEEAVRAAIQGGPIPGATHTGTSAERILLDDKRVDGHVLRKTWMVRTTTADPLGIWVTFVDGATGDVLSVHDEVRYIDGTLLGRHHERTVGDPLVDSPMPHLTVSGATDSDVTDADGMYTVTDSATYETDLDGTYLDMNNVTGPESDLTSASANMTFTPASATQAEIDVYVSVNRMRDWALDNAPEVSIVNRQLRANVNGNALQCNATYGNSTLNFYLAAGSCNNSGEISDVVFHEWGHGFHAFSLQAGIFDGSLSEGAADVAAVLQTDDSRVGPGFFTNGGWIRDVDNEQRYPENFGNSVHNNGLIFGGAMWDLWQGLRAAEGEVLGTQSTTDIFTGLLKGGPDIPGTWGEALLADDDDGDLTNGTPHICQLYEAFGAHGLGPWEGGAVVLLAHEPLIDAPSGSDHEIDFELIPLKEECGSEGLSSGVVHYRVDQGDWQQAAVTPSGLSGAAAIPEQPLGSFVEYYIEGATVEGTQFSLPENGIIQPYTFLAGDTVEVRCMDFEDSDGNFDSDLISGNSDDWEWGVPLGEGEDPSMAASGSRVWGTNLGGRNFDGQYIPNKHNSLESRNWRTRHYTGVHLRYQRWLTVEDGSWDMADIYVNDEIMWSNYSGEPEGDDHHIDRQWVSHVVPLGGIADQGTAQMRWELSADAGLHFGGWNIDDVCLVAPATPDNRLGVNDVEGEAVSDIVARLTWTQPSHAPVEEVRVVRRFDRYPENVEDGDLVWSTTDPVLDEPVVVDDINFESGNSFYAVYASDGTDWSSFTIDGLNATIVNLEGDVPPPGWPRDTDGDGRVDPVVPADGSNSLLGCACTTTGGTPLAGMLLLIPLLLRRRSD